MWCLDGSLGEREKYSQLLSRVIIFLSLTLGMKIIKIWKIDKNLFFMISSASASATLN
jgi:hypothetical protein